MEARPVSPEELESALALIRSGNAPIRFRTAGEVLQALAQGVVTKQEARKALGYPRRRQPRALAQARRRSRPAKS